MDGGDIELEFRICMMVGWVCVLHDFFVLPIVLDLSCRLPTFLFFCTCRTPLLWPFERSGLRPCLVHLNSLSLHKLVYYRKKMQCINEQNFLSIIQL